MDFVVVGGGVYGAGLTWELAKRGCEVMLLEAGEIASGASGGLGKRGVRANGRDPRELPLMHLAYELWPNLADELGYATGYERVGNLHLIEREQDHWGAESRAWVQNQRNIPTQLLAAEAVREMEPELSPQIIAALYCPLDGVADHTATTQGLARAAQGLGAVVREHTRMTGVERTSSQVRAVITEQEERITVDRALLLLSNTHVPTFLQAEFGITLPVWQLLPQIVLTEPVDPMPVHHLIGHAHRLLAMKSTPDGRVMVSGGWRGRWNPETGVGEPQPDQIAGNLAEAAAVYPCLEGVTASAATTDRLESTAIDGIPIIDRIPGTTNAYFGTGWSGHGWAISLAVNQLLASWMVDGDPPALLQPFRYDRFSS